METLIFELELKTYLAGEPNILKPQQKNLPGYLSLN
jgi:hypothetical protein